MGFKKMGLFLKRAAEAYRYHPDIYVPIEEKFEEIDLHTIWAPRMYCFIFYDIYLYIFMSFCRLQFHTIKIMEGFRVHF